MNNFFSPISVAIIILGIIFMMLTRKSLNKVVRGCAIEIKHRLFSIKNTNQEQRDSPINKSLKDLDDYNKIRSFFKDISVSSFDEFNKLLSDYINESETNKKLVTEFKERVNTLFGLWRYYMLSYLNLFLVANSKLALLWFYQHPNITKKTFDLGFFISPQITNPEIEKEAIFTALITNNLISKDERDLYKISNIGFDFLQFIGMVHKI